MEIYEVYKGYGLRYVQLVGTCFIEYSGEVIDYTNGGIKSIEEAKKLLTKEKYK